MFEIRVAVIGYVSVGKTTIINALFGAEYGEVAMKRTTAVVNSFRLSSSQDDTTMTDTYKQEDEDFEDDSIEIVSEKLAANATLKETATDNAAFRDSNVVKEKTFDISLESDLHKMRPDTKLVIVDIPGINEAGTSSKYKDFVNGKWHTFDIVVVVMDARQGVNTEEQHDLLKLVKENRTASKMVPVIVLSNKVDDPHNQEQEALLGEARAAVEKLFNVRDRKTALENLLDPAQSKDQSGLLKASLFPAVVPISAMHAFVYRCGSRLSFDEFCRMDADFIDKIGKDSYGRQWRRFGKQKQLKKAFEAVSEEDQRKDGVEVSNFDSFVTLLSICIGDSDGQSLLIQKQIDVSVKRMEEAKPGSDLGAELLSAHCKLVVLGKPVKHLPAAFWASYKRLKAHAFQSFKEGDFSPKSFSGPMYQLHNYAKALRTLMWPGEMELVVKALKELTLQYAVLVTESDVMKAKSPQDQSLIIGSMLLCSSETAFNAHFGFLRLHLLESKYRSLDAAMMKERIRLTGACPSCEAVTKPDARYGEGTEYCNSCRIIYAAQKIDHCPDCTDRGYSNQALSWKKDGNGKYVGQCSSRCNKSFQLVPLETCHEMKVSNGKLVPVDEAAYKEHVTVVVPESLDDPDHFGHVFWKCSQLLAEVDAGMAPLV